MKPIIIPETYNYIAVFLTFGCNYRCSYCINYFNGLKAGKRHLTGKEWIKGLNRIEGRVPLTLQGGEPSVHKDFIYIINNLRRNLDIDILTNLSFDTEEFIREVDPGRIKRDAPYANIRVSYHPEVMDLEDTIERTLKLQNAGFYIGLFGVMHPEQEDIILDAQKKCKSLGIDFRTKSFLGFYNGRLYGEYKYEGACEMKDKKEVNCKTTELLIRPDGNIYRCHRDLYGDGEPIGNILDPEFQIQDRFRPCTEFGFCNPCDVKITNNRFQQFGHCSVEIKFNEVASG